MTTSFVRRASTAAAALAVVPGLLAAQNPATGSPIATSALAKPIPQAEWPEHVRRTPVTDPTLLRILEEGTKRSQAGALAQVLVDSIGPRLTASPGFQSAAEWLRKKYAEWGIATRTTQYGTFNSWQRGVSHIDLVAPRVRSLEGMTLAWSPATANGQPVEGDVVVLPLLDTPEAYTAWAAQAKGKWVLTSAPQLSCRSSGQLQEFGTPEHLAGLRAAQDSLRTAWNERNVRTQGVAYQEKLAEAGALGVVGMQHSGYPGVNKVFGSTRQKVVTLELSCEDYGLVFRMAEKNQGPRLRVTAQGEFLGEQPASNTFGEIRGKGKTAGEYVMLSAHMDSWTAAGGATDNATGTIVMLEAMRILKAIGYQPKRTILAGHWGGEEQGLNGSRSFVKDNPAIVSKVHALFNQDNGTGRVVGMSASGFTGADTVLRRYLGQLPSDFTQWIRYGGVGVPGSGGTDHVAFVCAEAPGFNLNALTWDYGLTTWHTNRDTYDKIVIDDLRHNATLVAMLVYLASEDPTFMPRTHLTALAGANGNTSPWPTCTDGMRSSAGYRR
ncbi:MAG: M20/M25/M40 family metallo-hydrolase [Gemmatimonadaceae bacterium]|jgi:hypothetical protein|nr:M20/M25/M40 family metallo-hydrolase [Gemmatimonadaceae bacterium]